MDGVGRRVEGLSRFLGGETVERCGHCGSRLDWKARVAERQRRQLPWQDILDDRGDKAHVGREPLEDGQSARYCPECGMVLKYTLDLGAMRPRSAEEMMPGEWDELTRGGDF